MILYLLFQLKCFQIACVHLMVPATPFLFLQISPTSHHVTFGIVLRCIIPFISWYILQKYLLSLCMNVVLFFLSAGCLTFAVSSDWGEVRWKRELFPENTIQVNYSHHATTYMTKLLLPA